MLLDESIRTYNVKIVAYAVKETNAQHTNKILQKYYQKGFPPPCVS